MLDGHLGIELSADKLPSLSNVALEILRLTKDADASVDDLAAVIKTDPALTVKLLKAVNSPLFNLNREISSVKDAVNLLGMRSVRVLALSFSLVETARGESDELFDYAAHWRRSLSSAVAARLIGKVVAPREAEEAFVAGLLADLGMVAAWRCIPEKYAAVLEEWGRRERPLHEIEKELLGVTHGEITGDLMSQWGLPSSLSEAVAFHHDHSVKAGSLQKVVYAAGEISALFCQETPSHELADAKTRIRELTDIGEKDLEEILGALDEHVRDAASMLSVHVGETIDYSQLRSDAAAQLVQLSMMAEVDRRESQRESEESKLEAERLYDEKRIILEVASTDGLTKLANRTAFDKRLAEEIERATADDLELGLIMLDVDHFKIFNDTHGHLAGDEVLRSVGAIMREVVHGLGFSARYGGEEFVVITSGKSIDDVRDVAENLRRKIEKDTVRFEDKDLQVTVSLGGICARPAGSELSAEKLIGDADRNLYRAKDAGRNRVEVG